jgi:uncharacterized protein
MKNLSILLLCILTLHAAAQTDSLQAVAEITAFQKKLNDDYRDEKKTPLDRDDFAQFQGHDFFPIDLAYRVDAKFTVTEGTPFFGMKTTTSMLSTGRVYGYVTFTMKGKEFRLPVYQSKSAMEMEEYADHLFFPFSDETNGSETYGGGRYIDLRIPKEGDQLVIDFNQAYNPYCAYSGRYSCPLVPAENQLDIEVLAGVKYHKKEGNPADPEIFTLVETPPGYPGGFEAMIKFLRKNITYPRAAMKKKVQGTVYVQLIVTPDGSVTDVKTIKGISPECDREAERVVAMMPKWKPGQVNGKDVFVRYVLPINFKGRPGWSKN